MSEEKQASPQSSSDKPQASAAKSENNTGKSSDKSGDKPQATRRRRGRGGRGGRNRGGSGWKLSHFKVEPVEGKVRFHDLDLPDTLMHAIADTGFQYCSPIQARSLPLTLRGHDVVGKAQTGTGKTAAFLVAIIDDLLKNPIEHERFAGEARALIIAPTRELVMQIAEDARTLSKYSDLHVHTLVGGMDYDKQRRHLHEKHCDILVATPGRLMDFCGSNDVYLDRVEVLVIDEADRMLDMGFIPQVRRIVRQTPRNDHRQTLLFSATFTPEVESLTEQWTRDPIKIEIEPDHVATDSVTQKIFITQTRQKRDLLVNLLKGEDVESVIVFANRRDQCRRLQEFLGKAGFSVGLLSGEVAQNKRVRTLDDFKSGKIKVLVATDVAGRGIHIDGISHVVNFTLPEEAEDYVHRIGRTGRAGKTGTSISFACEDDAFLLEPIEALLGEKLACEQPPEDMLVRVKIEH
jgi:ATP-dependent RNA helicase RhlB